MSFEEDDRVVLDDKHSEHDGQVGTVTQVMETMFGEATYTVSFDDGQETGVPADQLEPAEDDGTDEATGEDGAGDVPGDDETDEAVGTGQE